MRSPMREIRQRHGWSKRTTAHLLNAAGITIDRIEKGTMRLPASFYEKLKQVGLDPFALAVAQENFIQWRRAFYFALRRGTVPPIS